MAKFDQTLRFQARDRERRFTDLDRLVDWLNQERDAWNWLIPITTDQSIGAQRLRAMPSVVSELGNIAADGDGKIPSAQALQKLQQHGITTVFGEHGIPTSDSDDGRFILRIQKDEGDLVASGALQTLVRKPINPQHHNQPEHEYGRILGVLRERGLAKGSLAEAASDWKNLGVEIQERLDEMEGATQSVVTLEDRLAKDEEEFRERLPSVHSRVLRRLRQQAKDMRANMQVEHDDLVEAHRQQLADIEESFREEMRLKAPVEYWRNKKRRHKAGAIWWGAGLALSLVGSLVLAVCAVQVLLLDHLGNLRSLELGQVVGLAAAAVPLLWFLRVLVRAFLAQMHLFEDSSQRSTMVEVYQALTAEGGTVSDEDRHIVLEALFRPSVTAFTKDELPPTGTLSNLTRPLR